MDEPTNALDVETLELLEEILLEFKGTVLLVSHDRAFLDNVVTSSLVFEGDGKISPYVGGYKEWLRQRPKAVQETARSKSGKPVLVEAKVAVPVKKKLSYKLRIELEKLPALMESAEKKLEGLQKQVAAKGLYQKDHEFVADTLAQLAEVEKQMELLMERWVELDS